MQDMTVNAAAWVMPDFAQAERRTLADTVPYEVDEASLAQFEAMLPPSPGEHAYSSDGDMGVSGAGAVGGAVHSASVAFAGATSHSEAGKRSTTANAPEPDAVVSRYTIHHARLGVVHVQHATGSAGAGDALVLRTDDDALRNRLRNAMPALRGAMSDGEGRGPAVSVDA